MVGMKRSIPSVNMTIPPPRGSPIRALPPPPSQIRDSRASGKIQNASLPHIPAFIMPYESPRPTQGNTERVSVQGVPPRKKAFRICVPFRPK
ncbi:hypothetical protein HMPREF9441_02872 [Paraprevotella clara YIT 11840]|uniref:Uncharacterized protein n=1 Tax=Paraprevotella clara YIT 11840 TaxID=762968 RepID=G5SU17_9BACT|nr:hypothetical protein HMPREF9441_02872 [Paraprevotella clara YIT 11840]